MAKLEYDYTNVFREIIDGKLEANFHKTSKHAICIFDIQPRFKTHLLIIPKGSYINFHHMMSNASHEEILDFYNLINEVISSSNLVKGYQLFTNTSKNHGQEIGHYHMHLVSNHGL